MTKEIVKEFFDNAVIIDDHLLERQEVSLSEAEKVGIDNKIEENFDEEDTDTSKKKDTDSEKKEEFNTADDVYDSFISQGIITCPIKYKQTSLHDMDEIISRAKFLILDWNLDDKTGDSSNMGETTMELISKYTNENNKLKCIVIYTKEALPEVKTDLSNKGFTINEVNKDIVFSDVKNRFVGFVMSKKIEPKKIIENISIVLESNSNIAIHFMACINELNSKMNDTLIKYNMSFEKVIYTQLLTSGILENHQISEFVNNLLLIDSIENGKKDTTGKPNVLVKNKIENVKKVINGYGDNSAFESDVKALSKIFGNEKMFKSNIYLSIRVIEKIFNVRGVESFVDITDRIKKEVKKVKTKEGGKDADKVKIERDSDKISNQLFLLLMHLDTYKKHIESNDKDIKEYIVDYKNSMKEQLCKFTELMKYTDLDENAIITGDIYKKGDEFLLCITPFCDTFRPEKVNNIYKFIKGEIADSSIIAKQLKEGEILLSVPFEGEIQFVCFRLYESSSLKNTKVNKYTKIATLKHEYIQSIINKYISYQARAGVNEIFYKESSYKDNFIGLLG